MRILGSELRSRGPVSEARQAELDAVLGGIEAELRTLLANLRQPAVLRELAAEEFELLMERELGADHFWITVSRLVEERRTRIRRPWPQAWSTEEAGWIARHPASRIDVVIIGLIAAARRDEAKRRLAAEAELFAALVAERLPEEPQPHIRFREWF